MVVPLPFLSLPVMPPGAIFVYIKRLAEQGKPIIQLALWPV